MMYKKKLVPVKQKINGTISTAINRYISMGVPLKLYRQQPITVIKSIYYRNNGRNDSALESIFVNFILDKITCDQRLLIINPSPIVVELIENNRKDTVYIVIDQTMADLYSKQFKQTKFIAVDNMHSVFSTDVMIVFTSNVDD